MLKHLKINNLILIDSSEIEFAPGFNVLSGETGSGKSAILNALELLTGERGDSGLIRRGASKGVVEAAFDIVHMPQISRLLSEAGIDHEPDCELIIRREISLNSKNRCFVNQQLVQTKILRQLTEQLIEIVGQHANQGLLSLEKHAQILDIFGRHEEGVTHFQKSWQLENQLKRQLKEHLTQESQRLREIEVCLMELEEIDEAHLKDGEEEALFSEYSFLSSTEERMTKIESILGMLSGEKHPVLPQLIKHRQIFFELAHLDETFAESAKGYEGLCVEMQEIAYTLSTAFSRIEHQPDKAAKINDRLTQICKLKKKYGDSVEKILDYRASVQEKLQKLENADLFVEELREKLTTITLQNNEACLNLSLKRKEVAPELEEALTQQLHTLNMPNAEFHLEISPQKRTENGDDRVEFFFTPNKGEHSIPIKECASGGELSRLMLGLQTLLAKRAHISTLVFDEIDSNIGGATAAIVGKKLKEIGIHHQVLCITHFPQVAQEADLHIQIFKVESDGRTITQVQTLDEDSRHLELSRMAGNSNPILV